MSSEEARDRAGAEGLCASRIAIEFAVCGCENFAPADHLVKYAKVNRAVRFADHSV